MGTFQAIAQGLGRAGSEYGQSREYLRQSKQQETFARLQALQSALGLYSLQQKLKEAKLPQFRGTFQDDRGNVHAILTDPTSGEPKDQILFHSPNKYPDFRTYQEMGSWAITHGDAALLQEAENAIKATQRPPSERAVTPFGEWRKANPDAPISEWLKLQEKYRPSRAAGATADLPEAKVRALAEMWRKGIAPPAKNRAQVEEYMQDHNMEVKVKLTGQEQLLSDTIKQVEPKVAQLKKFIEDAGLVNDNSFIFSNHSSLMQHLRFYGQYQRGVKPEQVSANLIKIAAALRVMPAALWSRIGRSKYTFEEISKHLPNPTDTPANLYDKAQFLEGITEEARASLPQTEGDMNALNDLFKPKTLVPKK